MTDQIFKYSRTGAFLWLLIGVSILADGCSGGRTADMVVSPALPNASLQVRVGDSPADRVMTLEMTVVSVTLTNSTGGSVAVLSSPTRIEWTHLAGTMEPVALSSPPQGTYSQATITVSSPVVTLLDLATRQMTKKNATLTSSTATLTFNPPLAMGSAPMSLNCDLNLAASLAVDPMNNSSVAPMFRISTAMMASEREQRPEDGAMEDVTGFVSSVAGNSFTLTAEHMTPSPMFATDSRTRFEGVASVGAMTRGMMAEVDAVTRPDGSLLATKVEVKLGMRSGRMAEDMGFKGIVTEVSGKPATQLKILVHGAASPGAMMRELGETLTVNLATNANFKIDSDHISLANLPFVPKFDTNTLATGQRIEADTDTGMTHMTVGDVITAKSVELKRQPLTGTVSGLVQSGTQATFTLILLPDSALALLTGATQVTVYKQPETELRGILSINNGDLVRVRGLLFLLDGGTYKLVAGRITGL